MPNSYKYESFSQQLSRLDHMAHHDDDNQTWDLSENDKRAISSLLSEYYMLKAKLVEIHAEEANPAGPERKTNG